MDKGPSKSNSGAALIIALLIMAVLTLLGSAAIMVSSIETKISGNQKSSIQAFYIAEAGIQHAIGNLTNSIDSFDDELSTNNGVMLNAISFASGSYTVTAIDNNDDDDQLTDIDKTIKITSTGTAQRGATKEIECLITSLYNPSNAITTNGDLTISGDPIISGSKGSVHSNNNLSISGDPTIDHQATASGTYTASGDPTIGGTSGGGFPNVGVPSINPNNFKAYADYQLRANGKVYDKLGTEQTMTGGKWNGWDYSGGKWTLSEDTTIDGTFYIEGNAVVSGNPGSSETPWKATIIATGDIEISGDPNMITNPDNPIKTEKLLFVAGGDLKINGNGNYKGIMVAHEQIKISGSPSLNGCIISEGAETSSGTVTENKISGNMNISFSGLTTPFSSNKITILSWREVY